MATMTINAATYKDHKTGKNLQGKPSEIMYQYGPLVKIAVRAVSEDNKPSLVESGYDLLDTGADGTCIMLPTLHKLNAEYLGSGTASGALADEAPAHRYRAFVKILDLDLEYKSDATAIDIKNLKKKGIIALIGRDLLKSCVFNLVLDGPNASFTLTIEI